MTQKIKIKYSHLNQGSLTQCYRVNKDSLVESISKENIRSCAIPTGYVFCCNDVLISFIVQPNTQNDKEYICKTCHSKVIKGKVPCQAVYNDMFADDIPTELSTLEKLEQILIAQRIVFEKTVVMPKGQQRKIKGAIRNVSVECDKICQTLPRAPESSGIILLKLKRKLQFRGHVYYQAVRPEIILNALNWLKANNELYKTITIDIDRIDRDLTTLEVTSIPECNTSTSTDVEQPMNE